MKLEEINYHVRDSRIRFDEEPHIYYIDGIPYDLSVTGFIKEFSEGFNTEQVIARNYSKWQSNKSHKYFGMSIDKIKDLWEGNRIDAAKKGSIFIGQTHYDKPKDENPLFRGLNFREDGNVWEGLWVPNPSLNKLNNTEVKYFFYGKKYI